MTIAKNYSYRYLSLLIIGFLIFIVAEPALAQAITVSESAHLKTLWLVIAGILVFFMNAGFAMLEAGLCQTRNATNILAKNLVVFCVAILAFWSVGFGLMFGNGNAWIGQTGFFWRAFDLPFENTLSSNLSSLGVLYPDQPIMVVFFFYLVFAGTAASIVSGAMAERVKFWAFFWFSFALVAIFYPLAARWVWNPQGWLATSNFIDFAGSTVVHCVGGMAGLVGAILIGPRRGWQGYNPDQIRGDRFNARVQTFNYDSLSLSTLGCLILWVGWLGFNGGSARSIADIPHILITTMFAGAAGGIFVLFLRGLRSQKPSLSLMINGILGGLVSITASSAYVSLAVAMSIGAIASIIVVVGEEILIGLKIDDPVGAITVHLGCGIWGTLAAGIFVNRLNLYIDEPVVRSEQIITQLLGIFAVNSTILFLSLLFWLAIGLAIHVSESFNRQLKSNGTNLSSKTDHYSAQNSQLPKNILLKYVHLAKAAIRVSSREELRGSDATFS